MNKRHLYLENDILGSYQSFALERYLTNNKTYPNHILLTIWRTSPLLILERDEQDRPEYRNHSGRARFDDVDMIPGMPGQRTMFCDTGSWQYAVICPENEEKSPVDIGVSMIMDTLHDLGIPARKTGWNDLKVGEKTVCINDAYMSNGFSVCRGVLMYGTNLIRLRRNLSRMNSDPQKQATDMTDAEFGNVSDFLTYPQSMTRFREELVRHFITDPSQMIHLNGEDYRMMDRIAAETIRRMNARRAPSSYSSGAASFMTDPMIL